MVSLRATGVSSVVCDLGPPGTVAVRGQSSKGRAVDDDPIAGDRNGMEDDVDDLGAAPTVPIDGDSRRKERKASGRRLPRVRPSVKLLIALVAVILLAFVPMFV